MQEKLIEILSGAKGWMTAANIADKGGWRSPANVGVALQQMEKANGSVVRRKSPTVKQGNGMPATEWRHIDKHFDGDHVPVVTKMIEAKPVIKESSTTEENLRQQIAHLKDQLAGDKSNSARIKELESETAEARIVFGNLRKTLGVGEDSSLKLAIEKLQSDMRSQTQRAEVAERNRDDLKKQAEAEHNDVLMWERTMLSLVDADSVSGTTDAITDLKSQLETADIAVIRWLDLAREYECKTIPELRVFIGAQEERINHLKNESNLIALNLEFIEGDNLAEKVCTVMHERIHAPKIVATEAAQFVVKTPSKPPRFTKKHANAHAAAMSAARQHGFAEVFALVPVGKAVRGAEWKQS